MSAAPVRACGRRVGVIMAAATIGLALIAIGACIAPVPRLIYNPTDSVPRGLYALRPLVTGTAHGVTPGGIVLTRLPDSAAQLAAARRYLPSGVPLLKRVGAVGPQQVCMVGREVRVDGVATAVALQVDRQGRALTAWAGCRTLADGEVFLLAAGVPASFDSRYFGPIPLDSVIGVARPVRVQGRP